MEVYTTWKRLRKAANNFGPNAVAIYAEKFQKKDQGAKINTIDFAKLNEMVLDQSQLVNFISKIKGVELILNLNLKYKTNLYQKIKFIFRTAVMRFYLDQGFSTVPNLKKGLELSDSALKANAKTKKNIERLSAQFDNETREFNIPGRTVQSLHEKDSQSRVTHYLKNLKIKKTQKFYRELILDIKSVKAMNEISPIFTDLALKKAMSVLSGRTELVASKYNEGIEALISFYEERGEDNSEQIQYLKNKLVTTFLSRHGGDEFSLYLESGDPESLQTVEDLTRKFAIEEGINQIPTYYLENGEVVEGMMQVKSVDDFSRSEDKVRGLIFDLFTLRGILPEPKMIDQEITIIKGRARENNITFDEELFSYIGNEYNKYDTRLKSVEQYQKVENDRLKLTEQEILDKAEYLKKILPGVDICLTYALKLDKVLNKEYATHLEDLNSLLKKLKEYAKSNLAIDKFLNSHQNDFDKAILEYSGNMKATRASLQIIEGYLRDPILDDYVYNRSVFNELLENKLFTDVLLIKSPVKEPNRISLNEGDNKIRQTYNFAIELLRDAEKTTGVPSGTLDQYVTRARYGSDLYFGFRPCKDPDIIEAINKFKKGLESSQSIPYELLEVNMRALISVTSVNIKEKFSDPKEINGRLLIDGLTETTDDILYDRVIEIFLNLDDTGYKALAELLESPDYPDFLKYVNTPFGALHPHLWEHIGLLKSSRSSLIKQKFIDLIRSKIESSNNPAKEYPQQNLATLKLKTQGLKLIKTIDSTVPRRAEVVAVKDRVGIDIKSIEQIPDFVKGQIKRVIELLNIENERKDPAPQLV